MPSLSARLPSPILCPPSPVPLLLGFPPGRGAGANDPDDLDDINLPEPQPEPQPQPQPEPVPAIPPAIVADADPAAAAAADPNPFALPPPLQDELPVLAVIAPDSPGALDGDEDRGFGGLDDQDVGAVGEHDNDEDNADDVDDNEAVMHEGGRMGRGLERMRVLVACALVGLALAVLPASAVLVPLLQGESCFSGAPRGLITLFSLMLMSVVLVLC